jgi:hydrogenase assembly chaperone HypC/HupF
MAEPGGSNGSLPVTVGSAVADRQLRQLVHERRSSSCPPSNGRLTVCIAFPGQVVALDRDDAIVEADGWRRHASLRMRSDVEVGDWVLVGAGSVLRRIDQKEATELHDILAAARASPDRPLAAPTTGGTR